MKQMNKVKYFKAISLLALGVAAPEMAHAADQNGEAVIVTGTRKSGIKAMDSAAPIMVLDSKALTKVGQTDLIQSLAQNLPSFTAQAFGGDTANLTLSAKLRGLSPNHALVLVDGKRRHTTANLAVLGGAFQGAASADLAFIPVASIGQIEVLQDGAAAQYGTDAIAGVINIITKKKGQGGSIIATAGQYFDGGGETADVSANIGFTPIPGSYLNLTLQSKWHGHSFRGGIDPRLDSAAELANFPGLAQAPGFPYLNKIAGDAQYRLNVAALSAGYDISDTLEVYTQITAGKKVAEAYENWRTPSRVASSTGVRLFPYGFQPKEALTEKDYGATIGISGLFKGWNWDLSTTAGKDDIDIEVLDSANASLYLQQGWTPRDFYAGSLRTMQNTTNFGANKEFEVGLASTLNVAGGLEYRTESYAIVPGDAPSRYVEGSQSFPGYPVVGSGKHNRDTSAIYADFAVSPIKAWKSDFAIRYENYSDFGDTTVFKFTNRYDFNEKIAVRGTASTGFRAPTLAEEYYTATNVSPTSFFVQLPPNSVGAALVGVDGLKPEKSTNYSIGLVAHPIDGLTITADAYQIEIKDRISGSGTVFASGASTVSPAAQAAILANGNVLDPTVSRTGINIFANGLDTRTKGLDILATMSASYGDLGKVEYSLSANFNKTEVTKIKSYPLVAPQSMYDISAISDLETASPKYKFVGAALWSIGKFTTNLRGSYFGEAKEMEQDDDGVYWSVETKPTLLVDLDVSYQASKEVSVTIGANNLFNKYPEKKPAGLIANYASYGDNAAVTIYPTFSPYGINGGYYYLKVGYAF